MGDYLVANPLVSVSFLLLFLFAFWLRLADADAVPADLPWVGKPAGTLFSRLRAFFSSQVNTVTWLKEGYTKYSRNGKSYIITDNTLGRPEVIVPQSQLNWLLDHPDHVLATKEVHQAVLEVRHAFAFPGMLGHRYHEHILVKILPRKLSSKVADIWNELVYSFDSIWGNDTENWREIKVYQNALTMISRVSNRLFVGLPLCRNDDYLENSRLYTETVAKTFLLLHFVPAWLKPILGPLVSRPAAYRSWRNRRYAVPIIKQRIANIQRKIASPDWEWEEPNDYLTWHIQTAIAENRLDELDPVRMSRYLMLLNFASIHTTVFALTNLLFDLATSDPSKGFIECLREEVERVSKEAGGVWSKQSLNKLIRVDSAIRESMRLNSMLTKGITRQVNSPEGILNKTEGWTAPQGAWISVNVLAVHHDPNVYPRPDIYDPFRFSRPQEEAAATRQEEAAERDLDEVLKNKNMGIVSTSGTFLSFGHGKHACPGRFFLAQELKMFVAYLVLNYDIEHKSARDPVTYFGNNPIPPTQGSIRIKRRKQTTSE